MLVRPDGSVLSKEGVLNDLRLEFKEIEVPDVKVRIHDDTAILTAASRTLTSRQPFIMRLSGPSQALSLAAMAQLARELRNSAFGLAMVHLPWAKVVCSCSSASARCASSPRSKTRAEIMSNPATMLREERESGYEVATFEQLREAHEYTRQMRSSGLLRPPRPPFR